MQEEPLLAHKGEELDENTLRDEAIRQLVENLRTCYEMMTNPKVDLRTREGWAQKHAYAAHALSLLLKDRQLRDWEKRLREVEAAGGIRRKTPSVQYPISVLPPGPEPRRGKSPAGAGKTGSGSG